jgi:hypothetical protein
MLNVTKVPCTLSELPGIRGKDLLRAGIESGEVPSEGLRDPRHGSKSMTDNILIWFPSSTTGTAEPAR